MFQQEVIIPHRNKNEWIASILTIPEKVEAILIICHGLTGNKTGPQKLQTILANNLVVDNILTVRFDFRGAGDSSGNFFSTTFSQMIEDTELVMKYIMQLYPEKEIFFLGLSIGAIVSSVVAVKHRSPGNIIISSDLAENLKFSGQLSIRSGEFHLNDKFSEERSKIFIRKLIKESGINCILYFGNKDYKVQKAADEVSTFIKIKGYKEMDHLFGNYEVRQQLSRDISKFIKEVK
ncbi:MULTISPECIES: alpha/beta hydrolase [Sutcliffiella]|uniref:Serine aminopeptidase S33 domain-containing protein n=1 Tax=Sutcliffiella cohnii TaxID=33932 RepID=A0A223KVX2_9BACI|nr:MULTISPECIES: alpha/beta fold hydrolase [Sutcliffiella]AST93557.1 hypothetical protein BC6307_20950 [Sutcliffiella cohnii]WBL14745.1 alpha/beta fold hydrolase [Sutcliffiella sp. NC1]